MKYSEELKSKGYLIEFEKGHTLKNHTLFPNTQLEGYFLIPYHKKVTDIDMIIKLGDMEFDYSNDKWGQ